MANLLHIVLGTLILQIYANAAPSDISKLEDIANVEQADTQPETKPLDSESEKADDNSTQGARQKRFYNYYGFGFPPINPLVYPNNFKRDESRNTGVYGAEDPLAQIHRRLQELAEVVAQPATQSPPVPHHVPIFFPVLFIPQIGCGCNEAPAPAPTPTADKNQTTPDILNRTPPVLEDERQNWGFVINETDDDDEGFNTRPISFEPIRINSTGRRPAPPVDHGSRQGDTESEATAVPAIAQNSEDSLESTRRSMPSNCDGAVLSCCHQAQVTYDCFALQGCPDPTSYGNPCASDVILSVIDKFQRFYGKRNG